MRSATLSGRRLSVNSKNSTGCYFASDGIGRLKIYTKVGDRGRTGLLGGRTCGKESLQIEAIGTVDELNCQVGRMTSSLKQGPLRESLIQIQRWLFEFGAELAALGDQASGAERISDEEVTHLERWIDGLEADLTPLRTFILPGGSLRGAEFHMARAICRRAERRVVELALAESTPVRGELLRFLNRLSDWFFVGARFQSQADGETEIPWMGDHGGGS